MSNERTIGLLVAALAATLALVAAATAGTARDGDGSGLETPAPSGYYEQPSPAAGRAGAAARGARAPEPQPRPSALHKEEERQLVVCECDELEVDARRENAYWQNRDGRRGQSLIFRGTLVCEPGDASLCSSSFTIRKKSAAGEIRAPLGRSTVLGKAIRCQERMAADSARVDPGPLRIRGAVSAAPRHAS